MYVCIYITHLYNLKVRKGYKINIVQLPGLWMSFNICHGLYCFSVHSITLYSLFANTKCCKNHLSCFISVYQQQNIRNISNKMILFTVTLKRINYQGGEGFPCWLSGKESTAIQEAEETWGWSLGWEVSLKEGMATHSSILAWKFPWIGVPETTVYGVAESWTQLKQISTHTQGAKDSYSEN